jgi:hypothetical protein
MQPFEHGRPADSFGSPGADEPPPPGAPYREIPLGVPESPEEFDERKRAARRPGRSPDSADEGAQIDHGDDDGGARS